MEEDSGVGEQTKLRAGPALRAALERAEAAAPWEDGFATSVTISVPSALARAIEEVGREVVVQAGGAEAGGAVRKSALYATFLRNGLAKTIEEIER